MSNIQIRKNDSPSIPTAERALEWDPGRLMRSMLGWDPFREMAPYALDSSLSSFVPAFEIKETKDSFLFKADLPGVKQQDIDVSLTGNRLCIAGKREAEKHDKTDSYYTYERSYGSFTRSFTMPEGIDAGSVHADLRDGVLTVNVAKKPEAQPRKIAVSSSQDKPKS